jgi:hypothetical protein
MNKLALVSLALIRSRWKAMKSPILAIAATICLATVVQAQTHGFSQQQLDDRLMQRRAFEAVVWGMPAVNFRLMYEEMVRKVGGDFNQILWWPGLLDWKNQTLTPNPDVIYLIPFFNTKSVGPMVLEIPPADDGVFNGSVMNYWQAAIEDVGPGGMDKGKGGKYLFLPPGYGKEKVPAGYIPMQRGLNWIR